MLKFLSLFLLHGYLTNSQDMTPELIPQTEVSPDILPVSAFAYRESIARLSSRTDLLRRHRMHHDYTHEVTFVIKQRNMEQLTEILRDVSNPISVNYGQHMTKKDISAMTSNLEAHTAVERYLYSIGATVISDTLSSEYIRASASISVWEETFDTTFFEFHQTHLNGDTGIFVRAEKYSIPTVLDCHVESVFNTIQMPYRLIGSLPQLITSPVMSNLEEAVAEVSGTMTTPAKLKAFYNLGSTKGTSNSTQCVYATINQFFSPSDLKSFQSQNGLPIQPVINSIGGYSSDSKCVKTPDSCAEGNLDVQYMMATSPGSPTTFWYSDLDFSAWLVTVSGTPNPPLIISMSYGAEEATVSNSELSAFNTEAIKLGAMGVTLVLATGDDGAVSDKVRVSGQSACSYEAVFPASCPYVVAVGGTAGVDTGGVEVVAQGNNGQTFTSGGGFSVQYDRPDYQNAVVSKYLSSFSPSGNQAPVSGYNKGGRAYPDVAFAGSNFAVVIGGLTFKISGTSASAPAFGGLLSNINAARMARGKGSVGWVNPAIYSKYTAFIRDITSGDNKCVANGKCCPQGFSAVPGWDPTTGLGSVDYGKMEAYFLTLGGSANPRPTASSFSPSFRPTYAPSQATYSAITVSQIVAGLTAAQAAAPTFAKALSRTISASIGLQATVSSVSSSVSQRRLLSTVTIKYRFFVLSNYSNDAILSKFQSAVATGVFLSNFKQSVGVGILSVSGLITVDISPTSSPTDSPASAKSFSKGLGMGFMTMIGIICGGGAALISIIVILSLCYCKSCCQLSNTAQINRIRSTFLNFAPAKASNTAPVPPSAPQSLSRVPSYKSVRFAEGDNDDGWQNQTEPTNH